MQLVCHISPRLEPLTPDLHQPFSLNLNVPWNLGTLERGLARAVSERQRAVL